MQPFLRTAMSIGIVLTSGTLLYGSVDNSLLHVLGENFARNRLIHESDFSSIEFSPDGKLMISSSRIEEDCEDSDIQRYLSDLADFRDSKQPLNPFAYQELINCGALSVPYIFNELRNELQNEVRSNSDTDKAKSYDQFNYPWNYLLYIDITNGESYIYNKAYFSLLSTALIQIGPEAVPSLTSYINNAEKESSVEYYQSLFTLYALGSNANEAIPALTRRLNQLRSGEAQTFEKPRDVIGEEKLILETLGEIGPASFQDLYSLLQDAIAMEDHAFIAAIISALGKIGPAAAPSTELLIEVLENTDADIISRSNAALALGKIGAAPSRVIPLLIEKIQLETFNIHENQISSSEMKLILVSFTALRMYGNAAKEAIPELKANLYQLDYDGLKLGKYTYNQKSYLTTLFEETIISLGEIGFSDSEEFEEIASILIKIVKDGSKLNAPNDRRNSFPRLPCLASTALGRQGNKVELMIEKEDLLMHEDLPVRILASHIMVNFKPIKLDVFLKNLQEYGIESGELETTLEACYDKAELAFSSKILSFLIDLLNEENESLRTLAASSIAAIGDTSSNVNLEIAVPNLINAVKTGDTITQLEAINTLGFIGSSNYDSTNVLLMSKFGKEKHLPLLPLSYQLLRVNDIHPAIVYSVGIGVQAGGDFSQLFGALSRFLRKR